MDYDEINSLTGRIDELVAKRKELQESKNDALLDSQDVFWTVSSVEVLGSE